MDFATALGAEEAIALAKRAEKVARAVSRLAGDVAEAWHFLSDENLEVVRAWGAHQSAELRFHVEYSAKSVKFEVSREAVTLDRMPFRQPLPEPPAALIVASSGQKNSSTPRPIA